ncbi:DUF3108 domain-containing protein [Candidatus Parabeggiatoa sp. HSG14]|uniref:DUF3108 domain-containing protein n=1 Tax=Candidatus Parabeggiatoa sp. HSG14 TaxID=3055593 RepID=UPI0025A80E84|nr:DUF3108 domain-containing protein [Thiotrichales bacterium HSG14]
MKQIVIGFLLLCSCALYAQDYFPPPFTAEYKLYANDISVGKGIRTLTALKDNKWKLETIGETTGLIAFFKHIRIEESSIFTRVAEKIRPKEYSYHQTGKKSRTSTVSFDWSKKKATNTFKGKTKEILLEEGTLDRLLYQVVLMQELKQGKYRLEYKIANKGKIAVYTPTFIGIEKIETGIGELKTLKYERISSNKKRRSILWCAPTLHYLPVQVEHVEPDGDVFTLVLQSVEGLK